MFAQVKHLVELHVDLVNSPLGHLHLLSELLLHALLLIQRLPECVIEGSISMSCKQLFMNNDRKEIITCWWRCNPLISQYASGFLQFHESSA